MMSDPPLIHHCGSLLSSSNLHNSTTSKEAVQECNLPLIDLTNLSSPNKKVRTTCKAAIAAAATEWGFFQVVSHGISPELFGEMRREQRRVFEMSFEEKKSCGALNDSYRWGAPAATSLHQFSWSEAFHVPMSMVMEEVRDSDCSHQGFGFASLREVMRRVATAMSDLGRVLAGVLAENLGVPGGFLDESCSKETCFLRLNRYPQCPFSPEIFGLTPHTDSDFLTILWQDEVGGLQLMKDSKWVSVRPNPEALIVNIGDLFQAWSNDVYKSVEHKVMSNGRMERYSIAYFLCPSYDSIVGTSKEPSFYKKFTFGDYRRQVQEDVKKTGNKVGLSRFLL